MLFCVCLQFCSFWQNALRLLSKQRRDWLVMAPNSCEESKQKTVLINEAYGGTSYCDSWEVLVLETSNPPNPTALCL